jgi:aminopeptidase N
MKQYILSLAVFLLNFSLATAQDAAKDVNVKFYHIDVEVSLDKSYIKGAVLCEFTANSAGLSSLELDLASQFKVSKVDGASAFQQKDNKIFINLAGTALDKDQRSKVKIYYEGEPPVIKGENGVNKGLIYSKHGKKENPVIATVCFPNGGYLWFPCKAGLGDKADSAYIDITIEDKTVEELVMNAKTQAEEIKAMPIIAVSNGMMVGVEAVEGGKKKFQWRHRNRIAPHHVLLAVSNFMKAESKFKNADHNFPVDFYVFAENLQESSAMMNRVPEVMACLVNTFGAYPFKNECFNVTEVGIPMGMDGMPTQTNVLLEDMKSTHLSKLVHQMASMWFGNHITPEKWQDAWITEALAAYSEAIWQEYKRGLTVYQIILDEKEYFEGGKLYLDDPKDYSKERLNKKGLYAIHMLRGIMSDNYFYETLKAICAGKRMNGKTTLSTKTFQEICEYYASENIERDYTYFFDEWVRGEFYPTYAVSYSLSSGKLILNVKQDERTTSPATFSMPYKIDILMEDGTVVKQVVNDNQNDAMFGKADQTFEIPVTGTVKDITFDPDNWIFKDLKYVRHLINDKLALEGVEIVTTEHRRMIEVKYNPTKKQDVTIELIQLADGVALKEDKSFASQSFKKESGAQSHQFKIPLGLGSRGVYKLIISTKGEVFTKYLRLKRIEEIF